MKRSNRNWWIRSVLITIGSISISMGSIKWGIAAFIVLMIANHFLKMLDEYEYNE